MGSPSDPGRCIAHADMDAFYASVEQRDHPELRGRPIAVGGAGPRGVVAAASYEARVFGVRSAMSSAEARQRCPELVFVPGDMPLYARESKKIFAIFGDFSPRVEGLSLDEAFLDLSGTERLLGPPAEVGARLRARVREELGLAVSVGIAPVKRVAKIASGLAKPDGLLEVKPGEVQAFLAPLPVRKLWGVGPVAETRIRERGFETIGQLAAASEAQLEALFGDEGRRLRAMALGEEPPETASVESHREAVSLSEENTFEHDVSSRELLEATILTHAESVARRLRRSGLEARTVVLKWRLGTRTAPGPRGYPLFTRRRTLEAPTQDGEEIARTAHELLAQARIREPVRLVGVGVTGLSAAGQGQLGLFGPSEAQARRARLNSALDAVVDRFGRRAIVRASQGEAARAGLSFQHKRGESDDEAD
jgi:DNA polymerase-4